MDFCNEVSRKLYELLTLTPANHSSIAQDTYLVSYYNLCHHRRLAWYHEWCWLFPQQRFGWVCLCSNFCYVRHFVHSKYCDRNFFNFENLQNCSITTKFIKKFRSKQNDCCVTCGAYDTYFGACHYNITVLCFAS